MGIPPGKVGTLPQSLVFAQDSLNSESTVRNPKMP
jgi:hypothetical protein